MAKQTSGTTRIKAPSKSPAQAAGGNGKQRKGGQSPTGRKVKK